MELVHWFRILARKWWIVVSIFVVTFVAVVVLVLVQKPVYQTTATLVIRPNISTAEDTARYTRLLETLSRNPEIASTFAEAATSRLIAGRAVQSLGLVEELSRNTSVVARGLDGKNVLVIEVSGNDPVAVRDLANATGEQTAMHAPTIYEGYELAFLDRATVPLSPIKPKISSSLVFGALLGIALGVSLAFLADYLERSVQQATGSGTFQGEAGNGD